MTTNETARYRRMSLISAAAAWTAALLIAAAIGGLWFLLAEHSPWEFFLLAAPLALIAVVVIFRQHSHARAERRFRAVLDTYADREQAKRTYSRRNFHARPQSQDRSTNPGAAL